ncbi:MAG: YdeI family protein [Hyphomicrobiaceae bacterium]
MSNKIDDYINRSTKWPEEMRALRDVLLSCDLDEALKWGKPCYAHGGCNIVIMQEMKAFLALMFFKGALLDDPQHVLVEQGPNSRSARRMQFTSVDEINRRAKFVRAYVREALRIEAEGLRLGPRPELELAKELKQHLAEDPRLKAAFEGLTPGRQREYNLFVSAAKQARTRETRVDRCAGKILQGKGLRE